MEGRKEGGAERGPASSADNLPCEALSTVTMDFRQWLVRNACKACQLEKAR